MARYIQPVPARAATGLVARVYEQIKTDFGVLAEPLTVHSAAPELLAGAWIGCRETLVVGRVERTLKETVAAAVSQLNRCPYCVDAHAMMLSGAGEPRTAAAIECAEYGSIANPRSREFACWAAATLSPESTTLQKPPFDAGEAPEIVGTAVLFHYINRVVNIFLGPSPFPIANRRVRGWLRGLGGLALRRVLCAQRLPGNSLGLLPDAELPPGLGWAARSETVAGAWSRWAAAVERAATASLSDDARAQIRRQVAAWSGEEAGLGRDWIDAATANLEPARRSRAELALFAALAPYRVHDGFISEIARDGAGEIEIVALVAFGAFEAAQRVGSWLTAVEHADGTAVGSGEVPSR